MTKRLFIAIPLPPTISTPLARWCSTQQLNHTRCIPAENLHITLQFLGAVKEQIIPDIVQCCQAIVAQWSKFMLVFKHVTCAPPQDPRHMIWAEFYNNDMYQALGQNIKASINQLLAAHGHVVQPSHEQTIPHVTVARCDKAFRPLAAPLLQPKIDDLMVACVQLMESRLNTNGSVYTVLETFGLQ